MIVDNALYRAGVRVDTGLPVDDVEGVLARADGPDDFVWVGLHHPTEAELERVGTLYGLHSLALEDAARARQRPKLERYDDSLFLALKTLWYVDADDAVETGQINLFIGKRYVVSVRHGEGSALHDSRLALEDREHLLGHGPAAVVYTICDQVVDEYEAVAKSVSEDVEEVEESVFSEGRTNDSERIYRLKRELAEMRRAVGPLREPMDRFALGRVRGLDTEAAAYFRDVADHLARVTETVDNLDSLLSTAFEAHLAQISLTQNEDMRTISAIVGIIAAPTLIAGIYGMNFDHMPELHWAFGYPLAVLLMVGSSFGVWLFARRHGWL